MEAITAFGRDLIVAHLAYLRRLSGVVVLITDVENQTINRRGEVTERESVVHGVELPAAEASWTWELAPRLEVDPDFAHRRRVVAVAVSGNPQPAG
jgi:hypothetical protein